MGEHDEAKGIRRVANTEACKAFAITCPDAILRDAEWCTGTFLRELRIMQAPFSDFVLKLQRNASMVACLYQ